jgi:hypothetical protein
MCCPPMVDPPMVENRCLVCPNGVTYDGEINIEGSIMMCSEGIDLPTMYETGSDKCTTRQADLEPKCCPPKVENPCLVCYDGITFDGEFEFLGATTTCFGAIRLAAQSVSDSDECAGSLAELEPTCCPPMVDPPWLRILA